LHSQRRLLFRCWKIWKRFGSVPQKIPNTLISNDATISPEATGLPNETEMKPQGSSFSFKPKNFKFKNLFTNTKENLLCSRRKINYNIYPTIFCSKLYRK
jgi:hypothetical protein